MTSVRWDPEFLRDVGLTYIRKPTSDCIDVIEQLRRDEEEVLSIALITATAREVAKLDRSDMAAFRRALSLTESR